MTTPPVLDEAAEAYMRRLLDEAPPLPEAVCALLVRDFARPAANTADAA